MGWAAVRALKLNALVRNEPVQKKREKWANHLENHHANC